ncbi:predicted protein [Nematostella vectensis]|uniref:Phosphatidylinositol-glycan-specific phospholipase D n=1 Tax=Nematostella vectensis TaxID=45351 RepID=A7SED1_NEMVE|nr:predicted protein [Nematostella vectensis]|eukprot:XP_001629968.1 predicted protein [Nematostella vectensis]
MLECWLYSAFLISCFSISIIISPSLQCGISTHIAIAHQALEWFDDQRGNTSYRKIILAHQDGFIAGNPYPDAMYSNLCYGGKYHQVAEDTHWVPFLNATVNYIRRKYPKPWDEATEKLVAFTLGYVSHQMADVTWHSLGIKQGFLRTMGDVNFFGSFPAAHSVGDKGGDLINTFEGDTKPVPLSMDKWFVPTKDLAIIYNEYYGKEVITEEEIKVCTGIIFLGWLGEKIAGAKIFKKYASASPFLTEQLHEYFQGSGLSDMAGWTGLIWHDAIDMLEHGTNICNVPHSPISIHCNTTRRKRLASPLQEKTLKNPGLSIPISELLDMSSLSLEDIVVEETHRGILYSARKHLNKRIAHQRQMIKPKITSPKPIVNMAQDDLSYKSATYGLKQAYAKLGWSISSGNFSGVNTSLVISAPEYGTPGRSQYGKVYLIHSDKGGSFPFHDMDLDECADMSLDGIVPNGRFGYDLAVSDLNKDGIDDLAVSAPSEGKGRLRADNLQYTGAVYVYYGVLGKGIPIKPDLTIIGKGQYYNLGTKLLGADIDSDGYRDLIIGSPYAPAGGPQRGSVTVFLAKTARKQGEVLSVTNADWSIAGEQDFSWFGNAMHVMDYARQKTLIVSAPAFRYKADCRNSPHDTQTVGRVYVYPIQPGASPTFSVSITGNETFMKLGMSLSVGSPYLDDAPYLAVSAATKAVTVHLPANIESTFEQSGVVYLLNMSGILQRKQNVSLTNMTGDRRFARTGWVVDWADVNMDGIQDLLFSAPFRTNDITEELVGSEEGKLYVYYGGKVFPRGQGTRGCTDIDPCPGEKEQYICTGLPVHSRFGSSFFALPSNNKKTAGRYVAVSAPRSSALAFHAGTVHLYRFTSSF